MTGEFTIRPGGPDDLETLLTMFDDAVAWLVAQGRTGQWGTEPFSTIPRRRDSAQDLATSGGLHLAEIDGRPAGALVVTEQPFEHIPAVDERELYVRLLLTAREFTGHRVGGRLLDHARAIAGERGIGLLRVDCWAGGDGRLVAYYTGQGFTPTEQFTVRDWTGQVLAQRLEHPGNHRDAVTSHNS
ncbi:GNAT family N-acetyltransferase [Pseudonocardiaceae bacterium YIM PH 21723]|nr:GNAT family N-acetyltransferase [Pseudonocardiaceae bacterium YIM PH 21723]